MSVHLDERCPLAERVIIPGDPDRTRLLADELLDQVEIFSERRGLLGLTGQAKDGRPLSIQTTGMGTPSLAIVVSELLDLGARRLVRVGSCGALVGELALGGTVVAGEAIAGDGASRALGGDEVVAADPELVARLSSASGTAPQRIVATDLFYDPRPDQHRLWAEAGAVAVEMESSCLFELARQRGAQAATILLVSDHVPYLRRPETIDPDLAHERARAIGQMALTALA